MERIREKLGNVPNEELFRMCLRSVSGCTIKVGEKLYNAYYSSGGDMSVDELVPEFELTSDEFEVLKKENNIK